MNRNQIINILIGIVVAIVLLIAGFQSFLISFGLNSIFIFFIGIVFLIVAVRRIYKTHKKYNYYKEQNNTIEDIENLGKEINKE